MVLAYRGSLASCGTAGLAGPAVYSGQHAGYQAAGRWFRHVATTVTVPPRTLPFPNSGSAFIGLNGRYAAWVNVDPAGARTALAMPHQPGHRAVPARSPGR